MAGSDSEEVGAQDTPHSGAGRQVVVEGGSKNREAGSLEAGTGKGVGRGGSNKMAAGLQEGKTEQGRK